MGNLHRNSFFILFVFSSWAFRDVEALGRVHAWLLGQQSPLRPRVHADVSGEGHHLRLLKLRSPLCSQLTLAPSAAFRRTSWCEVFCGLLLAAIQWMIGRLCSKFDSVTADEPRVVSRVRGAACVHAGERECVYVNLFISAWELRESLMFLY